MIPHEQRQNILEWVNEAVTAGARRGNACALLGLTIRSLQRWVDVPSVACRADGRPSRVQLPGNRFSEAERAALLAAANELFAERPAGASAALSRAAYSSASSCVITFCARRNSTRHTPDSAPSTSTALIVPALSAVIGFITFIASMISSVSPSFTAWPTLMKLAAPGSGAR